MKYQIVLRISNHRVKNKFPSLRCPFSDKLLARMKTMGHEDLPDYGDVVKSMTPNKAVVKILFLLDFNTDVPNGGFYSSGELVPW